MKTGKAAAVIFTWPKDYEMAGIAARALRNCGVRTYLAIDSKDPRVHIDGASLVSTNFPRGGNLNGMDCMVGIVDTLAAVAREEDDWVLKVDSDTLVHSLDWLWDVPTEATLAGTGHDPAKNDGRTLYGCCYAMRPSGIAALREQILHAGTRATKCEDLMIGNAGQALGVLHRYVLHKDKHMGPYLEKRTQPEMLERYQAICVQRTSRNPNARAEVVDKMNGLYSLKWPV